MPSDITVHLSINVTSQKHRLVGGQMSQMDFISSTFVRFFSKLSGKHFIDYTLQTAISSHKVMGMYLTKVWVMENIPRRIWSFSCN